MAQANDYLRVYGFGGVVGCRVKARKMVWGKFVVFKFVVEPSVTQRARAQAVSEVTVRQPDSDWAN